MECASLKLMLQPLVENSIYHGMEFMDGDGEIIIRAYKKDGELYLEVSDNGLGMNEMCVESLLNPGMEIESQKNGASKGSGIGIRNVNDRIKLYFGEAYGLLIQSEPDEGTIITIRLPLIPYNEIERKE